MVRPYISNAAQRTPGSVAVAAKNARMAWAVLAKGENFKPLEA